MDLRFVQENLFIKSDLIGSAKNVRRIFTCIYLRVPVYWQTIECGPVTGVTCFPLSTLLYPFASVY